MKVITLSKTFPKYHPRAGEQTGFADAFLSGRKIHTIRANENVYYKTGDVVSVRQWSGKPYASKQETLKDGVMIGVVPVIIKFFDEGMKIVVNHEYQFMSEVSCNDGLSIDDFVSWFNPRKKPNLVLHYSLIHFTSYRYE